MKTIKLFLLILLSTVSINLFADDIQHFTGAFHIEETCSNETGYVFSGEKDIYFTAGDESDLLFAMPSNGIKGLNAFVDNDSIFIPLQWWDNYDDTQASFAGKGKIINDSIFLHYGAGGAFGVVDCDCKGEKIKKQTEEYCGIVLPGSSWSVLRYGMFPDPWVSTQYIYFDGDSVVENKTYKKVFSCDDELHENIRQEGLIREQDKKTYFIKDNSDTEYILYDFALEEGTSFEYQATTLYVKKVDFVEISGIQKKRIQFTSPPPYDDIVRATWIEGIGSLNGLFYPCGGMHAPNNAIETLLCHFQDNEPVYKNPAYSECYYDKVEDIKMITDNKVWHIDHGTACSQLCFCHWSLETVKMDDTVLFNNVEYTKVISNWSSALDVWTTGAFIRETLDGKIYFYSEKCGKEFLMYDFDLQVGDKVILRDYFLTECDLNEQDESYTYTVTEVDSVVYNQVKRKYLKLQGQMKLFWIEGVGDIMGLLYHSAAWGGGASQLKDCYIGDDLFFLNDNPEYCFEMTDIDHVNYDTLRIFVDKKKILHVSNAKNTLLNIYDMQGRILQTVYPNSDNYETDISVLPSGLYIMGSTNTHIKFLIK
jgi:hypothetical protein